MGLGSRKQSNSVEIWTGAIPREKRENERKGGRAEDHHPLVLVEGKKTRVGREEKRERDGGREEESTVSCS